MFELFVASCKFIFHFFMPWILIFELGRFLILYLISVTSHSLPSPVLPILLGSTKSPSATSLLLFVFTGIIWVFFRIFVSYEETRVSDQMLNTALAPRPSICKWRPWGWSADSLGLWHGLPTWSFCSTFWGPFEDQTPVSQNCEFLLTSWDTLTRPWAWRHCLPWFTFTI